MAALRLLLKGDGYEIQDAKSPEAVLKGLEQNDFDAVLIDLNYTRDTTSGKEGLDLLTRIQMIDSTLPVVVMTAWGSVELAVEAMRRGARDFIQKPWDNARLLSILRTQIELGQALRHRRHLEAENELLRGARSSKLIAESEAMKPVLDLIDRIGPSDANVLITGEHGTGKEVVAQALHRISGRAGKPMVPVNVGGLAEGVFESEMFGHVKGAFTGADADHVGRFELANGGTLFLDEIANISQPQQARLLRVIETGEIERVGSAKAKRVDVRLVSATNADLPALIEQGAFREDLLFRLNTVEIHLPPLRQREGDIALLANHVLQRFAKRYGKKVRFLDPAAMNALMAHPWPGNVRELEHVIERAVLMATSDVVTSPDLGLRSQRQGRLSLEEMSLEDVERFLIQKMLERCDGNVAEAAKQLGLSRSAMYRRLQKYGS